MFADAKTLLWDATALSTDAVSDNTYDLGAAGNDISVGDPLCAILTVDVAAKHTGTETYQFDVIQSAAADLGSADVLLSVPFTTVRAETFLAAGKTIVIPLPVGLITKRYLGLNFDGANTPTVTVTAFIAPMSSIQMDKYYADNITIS